MTFQTRIAVVHIVVHLAVIIIHIGLVVLMASKAREYCVIARVGVAIRARVPFFAVFSAVNWEVLSIMIKSGRFPSIFAVAFGTISWEISCCMIRVGCLIVLFGVTSKASIGCVGVAAFVASKAIAGNSVVCTLNHIVIAVLIERGRFPSWLGAVAKCTIVLNTCCCMVWVRCCVVIRLMTGKTIAREVREIVIGMAPETIVNGMATG